MSLTRSQLDQIVLEEIKTTLVEVSPGQFASPESRAKYKEKARRLRARNVEKSGEKPAAPKPKPSSVPAKPKPKKDPPKKGYGEYDPLLDFKSEKAKAAWGAGDVYGAFQHEFLGGHWNSMLKDISRGDDDPRRVDAAATVQLLADQYIEGGYDPGAEGIRELITTMKALAGSPDTAPTTGEKPKSTDLTAPSDLARLRGSRAESAELVDAEEEVIDTVITDPSTKAAATRAAKEAPEALAAVVATIAPAAAAGKSEIGKIDPTLEKSLIALGFDNQMLANLYKDVQKVMVKSPSAVAPPRGSLALHAMLKQAKMMGAKDEPRKKIAPRTMPSDPDQPQEKAYEPTAAEEEEAFRMRRGTSKPASKSEYPEFLTFENKRLDVAHLLEFIDEEILKFRK